MFGTSLQLGRAFGIDVFLHWTFFLVPIYVFAISWLRHGVFALAYFNLVLVIIIFGCVLLHEFGHALAARLFSVPTRDIILSPIGGLARMERIPESSVAEFVIAIAGPLVNFVIAGILTVLAYVAGQSIWPIPVSTGPMYVVVLWANVALGVFNLVPAFPMDGGRIFRSILNLFMPFEMATLVAGRIGQVIALTFCILGFFYWQAWQLVLVSTFVFFFAAVEISSMKRSTVNYRKPNPTEYPDHDDDPLYADWE